MEIERQNAAIERILMDGPVKENRALRPHESLALGMLKMGKTQQLIVTSPTAAIVYVYAGEWVAECPRDCGNVEFAAYKPAANRGRAGTPWNPRPDFHCSNCHYYTTSLVWPVNAHDIMAVLDERPVPHTRHWWPKGHPTAVKYNLPDGQTVEDLTHENTEHGVS